MKEKIFKDHDCNNCARSKCKGDVLRDGKGGLKMRLICPGQLLPTPMKITLLERASSYDGWMNGLYPVLNELKMEIRELKDYPYFKFILNN